MALGDGIRRNIATVNKEERDLLIDAIKQLNQRFYSGSRTDSPAGHVSFWFKQDEIHDSTHVHGCPAFLPWHREMCNRFEASLREIHPVLSLHYWDWNTDPSHMPDGDGGFINLFDLDFMGNDNGEAGEPLLSAGFYNPGAAPNDRDTTSNPADPITSLTRSKRIGKPPVGTNVFGFNWPTDDQLLNALTWEEFNDLMIGVELLPPQIATNNGAHAGAHSYIGGLIGDPHTSFRDPFVFLLHSNVDRLWAMWQRKSPSVRLDPAQVYGTQENSKGSGNVATLHPNWGILSPLEPWASPGMQTTATGIISNVVSVRPWVPGAPPDNQQLFKDSRDLSVVIPPSYDTAVHSSYIVSNRDTFSTYELETTATYPQATQVIYDGFTPNEIGLPGAIPAISFLDAPNGAVINSITAINPIVAVENAGAPDTPQRISFTIDIHFADASAFPVQPADNKNIFLRATLASQTDFATIHLISQPNPYMIDVAGGNPSWLSTDVRVFQLKPGMALPGSGVTMDNPDTNSNTPYQYIQALLSEFRGFGNNATSPFENISQDELASQVELSRTVGGVRVLNFAVAKVRYRAVSQPATDVRVFFRTFNTMVSALDYNVNNYPRSADGFIPLPGTIGSEIASIPYFAETRVDSASQHDDSNKQPINASGQESLQYFGCWLDFNQPGAQVATPNGPASIMQLVRGIHQCLVAEIRFQPGSTDPISTGATPSSSDRLAQRNLAVVESDNPGIASTHVVQHTLLVKPSKIARENGFTHSAIVDQHESYDELVIRWNNLPRDTKATLFFPEWNVDDILMLASSLRQGPAMLKKADEHTLECVVSDISYIPIPGFAIKPYAGLLTLQLPTSVVDGEVFRVDVQQHSGIIREANLGEEKRKGRQLQHYSLSARKVLGAFRMTIPVKMGDALLRNEIRNLAVLRYIAEAIPPTDRWYPIFVRYIDQIANKVLGLGGDPSSVKPSPDDPWKPEPREKCLTGKVREVIYDCFGDFDGFVLESCSVSHLFKTREKGIGEIVRRACKEQSILSVYIEGSQEHRICKLVIKC